jgi:lipoprotein-releasing system ATP-binding protein
MANEPVFSLRGIVKNYSHLGSQIEVLKGLDLDIFAGDQIAVVGKSGVGKSTLLHVAGALDLPSAGKVIFRGEDIFGLSEARLAWWRNRSTGFVFQFHHLLPEFSALENVMMPVLISGETWAEAERRARELLGRVGLAGRLAHRPAELSGGEQQRVALARALVMNPPLLFADEPTGNLDERTSEEIHDLLLRVNEEFGVALVLVTHNFTLARRMKRRLILTGGALKDWDGTAP